MGRYYALRTPVGVVWLRTCWKHLVGYAKKAAAYSRGWRAWIGPGIGPEAFEVGADVFKAFTADDPDARQCFTAHPDTLDKWLADLSSLAQWRLRKAGVEHLYPSGLCTFTDNARFFSYRRDGVTGRMALLAWLGPQQSPVHAASDQTKK